MAPLTEYEQIQKDNIRKNEELLQQLLGSGDVKVAPGDALAISALGIAPPPAPAPKRKKSAPKPKPKPKTAENGEDDDQGKAAPTRPGLGTRRSARNASKPVVSYAGDGENIVDKTKMPVIISQPNKRWDDSDDDEDEGEGGKRGGTDRVNRLVGRVHDPKTFGLIPGVRIGTWWETRAECSSAAIHAPFVAGISGGLQGAYSVALSGGYDDDVDMGEAFTYTGSGGRDLKGTKANPKNLRTAPQSSHQTFDNSFNKSLLISSQTKNPVRVIRGFKLPSKYAPKTGYRYDGIYVVEKAWIEPGNNPGRFVVCKFAFRRVPGQPKIPEKRDGDEEEGEKDEEDEADKEDDADAEEEKENAAPEPNEPVSEVEEEEDKPPAKRRRVATAKAAAAKTSTASTAKAPNAVAVKVPKPKRAPAKKSTASKGRKMWVYVGTP
ncbi:hypothetical protein FRC07_005825 [Ceratobasidium sp. 392]|nr:hypothetical protein FRC07_005825 [Ceratobasidium sp. 392]